jgi:predicted O-linked N-acetylglucosamine transferase (SPINDLY family)
LEHIRISNYRDAAIELRKSLECAPDRLSTLVNLTAALLQLRRYDEAETLIEKVRAQDPGSPEGLLNESFLYLARRQYAPALACLDKALAARGDYAEAYSNRGVILAQVGQLEAAVASFDEALRIRPDYADALCHRGDALRELGRLEAAVASYEQAIRVRPDYEYLTGTLLHARMQIGDWADHAASVAALGAKIRSGQKASLGFPVLALTSSAELQQHCAQVFVRDKLPPDESLGAFPKPSARRSKIRLGYFSADFHDHATSHLMAGLFEEHDRRRFETYAFSFGPTRNDPMRLRVFRAFGKFIDVREMSDRDVARLSRELGVDIAIDLKGFTQGGRPGIFALRAAPVQVNYLGYPGTLGAEYIDYLIADRIVVPESNLAYCTERLAYLPGCYQANDRQRTIANRAFTRTELGLPQSGFVYCCFNNTYKISPEVFDSWARILRQVEGSALWLLADNPSATRNLRREAAQRGIEAQRLVFAERVPGAEHLARHRAADLFIDTVPYNAHTTASDALWAGLPLLTLQGAAFQGRVASSLLTAIGLPELVATTPQEYEAMAIRLAREPELLTYFRARLSRNRLTQPLFDTALFTRYIELAYSRMYERHCQGLPPVTFDVSPAR